MAQIITQAPGAAASGLDSGAPVVLASAITAAQSAPGSAIQGTNPVFGIQPTQGGGVRTLNLKAKGAGAVPTTVSVTLYSSDDNGSTWQACGAAVALVTTGTETDAQITNLVPGLSYQLLVTSLTLGSATSVSVGGVVT